MTKNRIVTKKQARREAYAKGIIVSLLATAAVFAAPKAWEVYRTGQREQLAKLKAAEHERKLQAEFEADREAVIRAEQEEAKRLDREITASNKRIQAKINQDGQDLQDMWAKGIYPEGNEDAYCGKCPKCPGHDGRD